MVRCSATLRDELDCRGRPRAQAPLPRHLLYNGPGGRPTPGRVGSARLRPDPRCDRPASRLWRRTGRGGPAGPARGRSPVTLRRYSSSMSRWIRHSPTSTATTTRNDRCGRHGSPPGGATPRQYVIRREAVRAAPLHAVMAGIGPRMLRRQGKARLAPLIAAAAVPLAWLIRAGDARLAPLGDPSRDNRHAPRSGPS